MFERALVIDDVLWDLCGPRVQNGAFDRREHILEDLASAIVRERFPAAVIGERVLARKIFGLPSGKFPAQTKPDLVIELHQRLHVLEVKASKTDDNRSQCELTSPFREYLAARGHTGRAPREVEQDLIKLQLFLEISPRVDTCAFLMVDAYRGKRLKWSTVFSDASLFAETMRTDFMKQAAASLVAATKITAVRTSRCEADLIICNVASRLPASAI